MTLRDFCKKYQGDGKHSDYLHLNVDGKKYLYSVTISFYDGNEPTYYIFPESRYISIGELDEFKNQVDEAYDLLKSHHKFLCELKLDEELTEEQENVLESIVHALS